MIFSPNNNLWLMQRQILHPPIDQRRGYTISWGGGALFCWKILYPLTPPIVWDTKCCRKIKGGDTLFCRIQYFALHRHHPFNWQHCCVVIFVSNHNTYVYFDRSVLCTQAYTGNSRKKVVCGIHLHSGKVQNHMRSSLK